MPGHSIGVLTFHRCINYGSYWQARCLTEGLRAMGHDAVLMDHRSSRVDRREWTCALAPVPEARSTLAERRGYAAKARRFFEAFDQLPLSEAFDLDNVEDAPAFDLTVVGSDEVWNLSHPWYGGHGLFYGDGLQGPRVSYAASFGNQRAEYGIEPSWAERLMEFSEISVRDENSRRLVQAVLNKAPEMVLDPCLQFSELVGSTSDAPERPYVAVYGHSFPAWYVDAIRAWAGRQGVALISIGYRNDWADAQWIEAGPLEFAGFMARANAVVTNFFHGCVFSLVNERPFVCAASDYRSTKVTDLLHLVGAPERLLSEETAHDAAPLLLDQPPDATTYSRIAALRQRSYQYLKNALH